MKIRSSSSIRITNKGRTIHATGDAAQSLFEALRNAYCLHEKWEYRGGGDFEYCAKCGLARPR